jgi:RNA polymerase sigma factor (sigma-70 family)
VIEDLLQEIFVRAFAPNARENFDAARPYFPYLKAIARNCFVDMLRARGREVLKAPDELDLDVEGEEVDSDPVVDPRVRRVLTQYLGELSAPLEGVYRERFVLGRSQDDASKSLGLSRRQLRTAEEHLRSGLRRALQRAGVLRGEIQLSPQQVIRPTPRRSPN